MDFESWLKENDVVSWALRDYDIFINRYKVEEYDSYCKIFNEGEENIHIEVFKVSYVINYLLSKQRNVSVVLRILYMDKTLLKFKAVYFLNGDIADLYIYGYRNI